MWKRNGLSLVLLALTAVFIIGQAIAGHHVHNQELVEHGRAPLDLWHYLATGHFVSATFENWEANSCRWGCTCCLRSACASEARPSRGRSIRRRNTAASSQVPRHGRSGAVACGRFFTATRWPLHSGCCSCSALRCMHWGAGGPNKPNNSCRACRPGFLEHLASSTFWFESMQNWQSEFLAVLSLVVLTIFLRQKDSPQSRRSRRRMRRPEIEPCRSTQRPRC